MNTLYFDLSAIFWVSFVMTIWYHSDIVITIGKISKLLGVDFVWRRLKLNEYTTYKLNVDVMASYPDFLYSEYPNVFTKLISCNLCFPFWLTLLHTSIIWHWSDILLILPMNYCCSLTIYLLIKKLL